MGLSFNFWDTMAKRYPRYNDEAMRKEVQMILKWTESKGIVFENSTVLDIGCGTGTFAIPLAQKKAYVSTIEPSEKMLEILHNDAKELNVDSFITTYQSDWDSFTLKQSYDTVIASMTPAIHDNVTIDKMIDCATKHGLFVVWGSYRTNHVVEKLLKAHRPNEHFSQTGTIKAKDFMERLRIRGLPFEHKVFTTSWQDTYEMENAKEYAIEQLKRREITPNETLIQSVLDSFVYQGKIVIETKAEKVMLMWNVPQKL